MRVANIKDSLSGFITGDKLVGEVSRLVVAEACIQALDIEFTQGKAYEINSVKVLQTVFLECSLIKKKHVLKWRIKTCFKDWLVFDMFEKNVIAGGWSRK